MIDCHAHLACADFDADRSVVIDRARNAGVERVIVVSEDASDSRKTLGVCARWADVLSPTIGLHPDRFGDRSKPPGEEDLVAIETLAREYRDQIAAIGEVGLNYWVTKDEERRTAQRTFLVRMVTLSRELDKPLNVHSRSAGRYTLV